MWTSAALLIAFLILPALSRSAHAAAEVAATAESPLTQGEYLVRAANCVSCHTAKDGIPFAGGKAFQTTYDFFGKLYSSNITPDPQTGIGNWTEGDFIQALRFGIAPGGRHLFPAFPYTAFTKLTTADLKAIFAYLRTVPAVHVAAPENSFWFRQRWVMVLWNALFFSPGEDASDSSKSAEWNRGRYLETALGHCGACHSPRNTLLAESTAAPLTGGLQMSPVEAGEDRLWSAPNLTSATVGLGAWSAADLEKYLKTGSSRRAGALGPMNEVIANSLRFLTDADARALALYVKDLPAAGDGSRQRSPSAAELGAGQVLYDKYCAECHLSTGRGGFRKSPPLTGSALVQAPNAASLMNVILYGAKTAAELAADFDTWEDMPAFKDKMNNLEIAQLTNFLTNNWTNRGPRVSPREVAMQR